MKMRIEYSSRLKGKGTSRSCGPSNAHAHALNWIRDPAVCEIYIVCANSEGFDKTVQMLFAYVILSSLFTWAGSFSLSTDATVRASPEWVSQQSKEKKK